jgi:hypothetical protein
MSLQMLIMPNKKLYVLITYMVLGPLTSWAPGGRTACPPLRAGPARTARDGDPSSRETTTTARAPRSIHRQNTRCTGHRLQAIGSGCGEHEKARSAPKFTLASASVTDFSSMDVPTSFRSGVLVSNLKTWSKFMHLIGLENQE